MAQAQGSWTAVFSRFGGIYIIHHDCCQHCHHCAFPQHRTRRVNREPGFFFCFGVWGLCCDSQYPLCSLFSFRCIADVGNQRGRTGHQRRHQHTKTLHNKHSDWVGGAGLIDGVGGTHIPFYKRIHCFCWSYCFYHFHPSALFFFFLAFNHAYQPLMGGGRAR